MLKLEDLLLVDISVTAKRRVEYDGIWVYVDGMRVPDTEVGRELLEQARVDDARSKTDG